MVDKALIEKNKEQIYQIKKLIEETVDLAEKRTLKRRLRQLQIEQLGYLNTLG